MKKLFILLHIVFVFGAVQAQQGGSACNASFSYTIVDDISALTVQFTNQSLSPDSITHYEWDFGDGQGSAIESPRHQYLDNGTYIVSLKIKTIDGCSDTHTDSLLLEHSFQSTCFAFFSYYPDSTSTYSYGFTDHSSGINSNDHVVAWIWDFNDGSPVSNIQHPTHNFGGPGTFNVSLTITTDSGCTSQNIITLNIGTLPPACKANFDGPPSATIPLTIDFHDLSIPTTSGSILSWRWVFGDGDTVYQRDVTHTFPHAGLFDVELKIKTANCSDSITIPYMVGNPQRYNMWGHVYAGPYPIDKCIAYLYMNFQNKLFVPIDTVELTDINDTLGVYYFYQKYEGEHLVKLVLPQSSNFSEDFISTYYGDDIYWQNANTLSLFHDISQAHINLKEIKAFDQVVGNGFLQGKVDNSGNATQQKDNVEVLLLKINGQPVDHTFTDALGNFSFSNVPYGDYYLTSDITGLDRIPVSVQLNSSNDSISGIQLFIRNEVVMGIYDYEITREKVEIEVYPNPVSDDVHLKIEQSNTYSIQVYDVYGRLLISLPKIWLSSSSEYKLSLSDLPSGIYLMNLESSDKTNFAASKIIKQ